MRKAGRPAATSARLARLLAGGADAVQVACALGISLQRARALIEEFQAPDTRPHEAGSDTRREPIADPAAAWPAGGPSGASPPAPANAGSRPRPPAPTQRAAGTLGGPAAIPRVGTPFDPSPPARPSCRSGDAGPALPLSQAVLDALGIELAGRR